MEIDEEFVKKFMEKMEEDMGLDNSDDVEMHLANTIDVLKAFQSTMNELQKDNAGKDMGFKEAIQDAGETTAILEKLHTNISE